jgi:hypothetical protein
MGSMGTTSAPSVKVVKAPEKQKVLSKDNPQSNPKKAGVCHKVDAPPVNTPKY